MHDSPLVCALTFLLALGTALPARGQSSSDSFLQKAQRVGAGGGRVSSSSFQAETSIGQAAVGVATSASFGQRSGFVPASQLQAPSTFTVDATGDGGDASAGDGTCATSGGDCTLRAALEETNALSNASTGPDEIHFDIAGAGPHPIQPQSALPDVTDPVVIDGSTEPDFSDDPVVVIDGSNVSGSNLNLEGGSGGSSVLDLSLINSGNSIALFIRTDDNLVDGCWIGLAPDGTTTQSNSWGLRTFGSSNQLGDPNGRGNVIVASNTGIGLAGDASNNAVQNNRIGETPPGTAAGNGSGIDVGSSTGAVRGNMIGGTGSNEGNLIAHNSDGVLLSHDDIETTIRGNRIFDNSNLGIDLAIDGQTANDQGDTDDGVNHLQNFPEVQGADYDASANEVTVTYLVPSDPNASGSGASTYPLTVDFYRADADNEEGEAYLGTDTYSSSSPDDYAGCGSAPCAVTTTFTPAASVARSDKIVATATDDDGNTSEFSAQPQQLPVELATFEAKVSGGGTVRLTWQTVSETNNARFEVQRRGGGQGRSAWETIGSVEGAGTTSEPRAYRFTDADLPYAADSLAYRLRQVDTDGTGSYSEVITVRRTVNEVQLLETYPNPARKRATLRYAVPSRQNVTISLYDVLGRRIKTVVDGKKDGRQEVQLRVSDLPSGVYFLRLRADGQTRTRRLTVLR